MRERLIASLLKCDKEYDVLSCYKERPKRKQAAEIIADHLLADGIIAPPCKVGDKVYCILKMSAINGKETVRRAKIEQIHISISCRATIAHTKIDVFFNEDSFGRYVFPTKKKAKAALWGR